MTIPRASVLLSLLAGASCLTARWQAPPPPPFATLGGPTRPIVKFCDAAGRGSSELALQQWSLDALARLGRSEGAFEERLRQVRTLLRGGDPALLLWHFSDDLPDAVVTERAIFELRFPPVDSESDSPGAAPARSLAASVYEHERWRLDDLLEWPRFVLDTPEHAAQAFIDACRSGQKYHLALTMSASSFDRLWRYAAGFEEFDAGGFVPLLAALKASFPDDQAAPEQVERVGYTAKVAISMAPVAESIVRERAVFVLDPERGEWRLDDPAFLIRLLDLAMR